MSEGNGVCLTDMDKGQLVALLHQRDAQVRNLEFKVDVLLDRLRGSPALFEAKRVEAKEAGKASGVFLRPCHTGDPGAIVKHAEIDWAGDLFVLRTDCVGEVASPSYSDDEKGGPVPTIKLRLVRYVPAEGEPGA